MKAGFDYNFESPNYHIETNPLKEWRITADGQHHLAAAADMLHDRQFPCICKLMNLDRALTAKLERCEVIAIVLYTGPMVSLPLQSSLNI